VRNDVLKSNFQDRIDRYSVKSDGIARDAAAPAAGRWVETLSAAPAMAHADGRRATH
jgi:hypothetical protein